MTTASEPYVLNIGPQHPSTHGVFRLRVVMDGERIQDIDMVVGYLHRSMEKLAEERTYTQNIPFTDRTDYLAAMSNNLRATGPWSGLSSGVSKTTWSS